MLVQRKPKHFIFVPRVPDYRLSIVHGLTVIVLSHVPPPRKIHGLIPQYNASLHRLLKILRKTVSYTVLVLVCDDGLQIDVFNAPENILLYTGVLAFERTDKLFHFQSF